MADRESPDWAAVWEPLVATFDASAGPSLPAAECLAWLDAGDTGVVVLSVDALPMVVPVRYRTGTEGIHLTVPAGLPVAAALDQQIVGLQASGDDGAGGRWTVMAVGRAAAAPTAPPTGFIVTPTLVHGYRFEL
ncbi:MAG: pyridoxamine 5'-phosphate oxidase family protein [Acidobacteriota bacterium]|nr:pyridoxamine 5'-phosphate oxidase family protein [Acidobacteriota bacterium]